MTQEVEIEFKNLLTKEEYKHILHHYPFPKTGIEQCNYYFETTDFALKDHGCALRIREKDGKFMLTLKEPHPEGLLETHDALTKDEARKWIGGQIIEIENVSKQLAKKNIVLNDLTCQGKLKTIRREIKHEKHLLVLDCSTYNGKIDYELEIESLSVESGKLFFQQFLMENNIEKRKTPNKIERFFASLL